MNQQNKMFFEEVSPFSCKPIPEGNYLDIEFYFNEELEGRNQTDGVGAGQRTLKQNKNKSLFRKEGIRIGRWDKEEKKKYHWFLEIYHTHFINKHLRKVDRIFKVMEIFLKTRLAEQCRSHHQKMEKRYGNFMNIILNLRRHHYSSQQSFLVERDMEKSNLRLIDGLLPAYYLQSMEPKNQQKASETQNPKQISDLHQHQQIKQERDQRMSLFDDICKQEINMLDIL